MESGEIAKFVNGFWKKSLTLSKDRGNKERISSIGGENITRISQNHRIKNEIRQAINQKNREFLQLVQQKYQESRKSLARKNKLFRKNIAKFAKRSQ